MSCLGCTCLRYVDETGRPTGAPISLSRCELHPSSEAAVGEHAVSGSGFHEGLNPSEPPPSTSSAAQDQRETLGYEVVIRFFPGSGREAHDFFTQLGWPSEQVQWARLDRIVVPEGEERVREASRSRSRA